MPVSILLGLAAGTLLSEDLSLISAGLLSRDGVIGLTPAIVASAAGVYVGDIGLWVLGRVCGRRVLGSLGARLDEHLGVAVLCSRFLPGSRLPMYLALGAAGRRPLAFAGWSFLAVMLWTPALVGLTYAFGSAAGGWLVGELNSATRYLVTAIGLWAAWRLTVHIAARSLPLRT